ncbi:MAG: sialidase family protein [Methylococcales bacterium]
MSLILGIALSSVGGASVQEAPPAPSVLLGKDIPASSGPSDRPAVVQAGGELIALYSDAKQRVALRRGEETRTLDDDAAEKGGGNFLLHDDGKILYAVWWRKGRDGKRLYLRASNDRGLSFGALKVLNSGGGVLPGVSIATGDSGRVAVAYMDERSPGYQVYLNHSTDGGGTWLAQDIRLDDTSFAEKEAQRAAAAPLKAPPAKPQPFAVDPRLVFSGKRLIAVWQQQDAEGEHRLLRWLARVSEDGGQTWGAPMDIYREADNSPFELIAFAHRDRVYVFGFAIKQGLMAFRSDEAGGNWQALGAVPGTAGDEDLAISGIRAAASGDNVLVSYASQKQSRKTWDYVARLAASSGKWQGEPWRLDRKEHELTKSGIPEMTALPDGTILAVWEDYRNLLPALYLDYTTDGGASWGKAPRPLTEPGLYYARWPRIVQANDRILVVFDRTDADKGAGAQQTFYQTLPYDERSGLKVPIAPDSYERLSLKEKKARLKKRMEEFWALRAKGKFEETWEYYDPAYRGSFPNKLYWLARQADITYDDFSLPEDVAITGVLAKAPFKVTVSMPQQMLGDMISEVPPPKVIEDKMQWGWFHDNWYCIPETMLKEHLYY